MGKPGSAQWEYIASPSRHSSSIVISVWLFGLLAATTVSALLAWWVVEVLLLQRWVLWPLFGVFVFAYVRLTGRRQLPAAVVRVNEARELLVEIPELGRSERLALEQLEDVVLDSRTVEPVREAAGPNPALRFIDATVGPAYDETRIVLVTLDELIPLFRQRVPSIEVERPFAELRKFLRGHGWKPLAERQRTPSREKTRSR